MTVAKEIYKYLSEHKDWTASGDLERMRFNDATGSTITRQCRELREKGFLKVRYQPKTGHAEYMALTTKEEQKQYMESSEFKDHDEWKPQMVTYIVEVKGQRHAVLSPLKPEEFESEFKLKVLDIL